MKWRVSGTWEVLVKSFLGDFNGCTRICAEGFEDVHGGMVLEKEMQKEEDCWSSVMKKSCKWQTLGFIRQTKEKSLIAPVDMKQQLILC